MKTSIAATSAALFLFASAPALAAPGLGTEVYSPQVEEGEVEIEARWASLNGGVDDGESVILLEGGYSVTDRLHLALVTEIEKEPGSNRELEAGSIEAIYELGRAGNFHFGLYGEYEVVFEGADKIETKFLVQNETGPWDFRLNLIAEKEIESGAPVEFEYAASADVAAFGEFRLGAQAFGQLGTASDFLPRAEHFLGPVTKFEVEGLGPELEFEVGYLFALGAAKDETDGQIRVGLEVEF